ncbi:MAG: hypothetical protein MUP47_03380 [Phycisphaerae bacterium]|nr:hypothetical protein [Phycisphaerae bacterium]
MSLEKQFNRTLDGLWQRRTAELRALVTPQGRGRHSVFTKRVRKKYVGRLLDVATRLLVRREGKRGFNRVVERRLLRFVRGRGLDSRLTHLLNWAKRKCPGPIVYAFWRAKKCLYVGKGASWRRLRHYDKSAYLIQATCLEVFCIHGKSHLAKAECLATHLFRPRDQKIKPARQRWGKACPICRKHDRIRKDLHALFKMQ